MPTLLVPPDEKCNTAYQQIAAIARAHGLVVSAAGGMMTIAIPERQREAGVREKVLSMHCMTEVEDSDLTPPAQWPKRKATSPAYKSKPQIAEVDLTAFEE